jgi:hypothetical protein
MGIHYPVFQSAVPFRDVSQDGLCSVAGVLSMISLIFEGFDAKMTIVTCVRLFLISRFCVKPIQF